MTRAVASRTVDTVLLALTAWCLACGAAVDSDETVLECYSLTCPDARDVVNAVEIFGEFAPLDRHDPITIEWHAVGETFGSWTDDGGEHLILALTVDADRVQVSSWDFLAHELMHLNYWRSHGDPDDANHEEAPGPWTRGDSVVVGEVASIFHQTFSLADAGPTP